MDGDLFGWCEKEFAVFKNFQLDEWLTFSDCCSVYSQSFPVQSLQFDIVTWAPFVLKVTYTIDHHFIIDNQIRNYSELGIDNGIIQRVNFCMVDFLDDNLKENDCDCKFVFRSRFHSQCNLSLSFLNSDNFNFPAILLRMLDLRIIIILNQRFHRNNIRTSIQMNFSGTIDSNRQLSFELKNVFRRIRLNKVWNVGFESWVHLK